MGGRCDQRSRDHHLGTAAARDAHAELAGVVLEFGKPGFLEQAGEVPHQVFVNAQAGWRFADGRYEVGLWGRNLFGETNIVDITPIASLGFDVFSVGPPRTYGVYLRAKY